MGFLSSRFFKAETLPLAFSIRTELRARQPLGPDVRVPGRPAPGCRQGCTWLECLPWVCSTVRHWGCVLGQNRGPTLVAGRASWGDRPAELWSDGHERFAGSQNERQVASSPSVGGVVVREVATEQSAARWSLGEERHCGGKSRAEVLWYACAWRVERRARRAIVRGRVREVQGCTVVLDSPAGWGPVLSSCRGSARWPDSHVHLLPCPSQQAAVTPDCPTWGRD